MICPSMSDSDALRPNQKKRRSCMGINLLIFSWNCQFSLQTFTCQWLATGRWFSSSTPVSSIKNWLPGYVTEILLKVALNSITHNPIVNFTDWYIYNECFFYFLRLSVFFSMILFLQDLKAADIDVSDQKIVTNKWLEQCLMERTCLSTIEYEVWLLVTSVIS